MVRVRSDRLFEFEEPRKGCESTDGEGKEIGGAYFFHCG